MIRKKQLKAALVGARISEIRGKRTLEEFAAVLGIKNPTVYRYETDRLPGADMLLKIAALDPLKRGVEWLLTGESSPYYKEGAGEAGTKLRVVEAPEPYRAHTRRVKRLLREIDDLVNSGDDLVVRHLERQIELLKDSVAHRKEKKDKA